LQPPIDTRNEKAPAEDECYSASSTYGCLNGQKYDWNVSLPQSLANEFLWDYCLGLRARMSPVSNARLSFSLACPCPIASRSSSLLFVDHNWLI
jgi:hypothetical protein